MIEDTFHLGVKALLFNPAGKVLLLEREHSGKKLYWDLPGGRLQTGETAKATLLREVKEETGLEITGDITPFASVFTDIRIAVGDSNVGLIYAIFCCPLSVAFEPRLSDEHINFGWFTPSEASQKLRLQYPNAPILKAQYPSEFIQSLENFIS